MLSRYKRSLVSLFAKVQELNDNPWGVDLCLEIQETLINRITYVERKIRTLRGKIRSCKQRLRTAHPVRLSKDEAREQKGAIEYYHYLIGRYEYLLEIFREVGDGIAFTYIDKWDIKPMAYKESAGFLSGKKGARLERKMLRGAFGMGIIVILNDLTNCLRYSDITVPRSDGKFMLLEAKSGGKRRLDERGKRQLEKARNITNYLDTDLTQSLYGKEGMVGRAATKSKEVNHRDRLNEIVREALKEGVSWAEVEEGVFYHTSTRFEEASLNCIAEKCERQPIIELLNVMDNTAYYPFTLSIRNPEALYEFYKGRLNILVMVNANVMRRKCSAKGFDIEFLADEDWMFQLRRPIDIENGDGGIRVGRHIFGRVFAEFLSLDWFLNEMMGMENFDPSSLVKSDEA